MTIESTIKKILAEELEIDAAMLESADASTPLLGRGIGLDSVEAMRLTLGLENAFDISIPDTDLKPDLFSSIGSLSEYVAQRIAEREVVK